MLKQLKNKLFRASPKKDGGSNIFDLGFHGDTYLLQIADVLLADAAFFVETGTNVGSTLRYVASRYPELQCYSCELDKTAYRLAQKHTEGLDNVHLFNLDAVNFLNTLQQQHPEVVVSKKVVFWLDAHGRGFRWPLLDEITFVTETMHGARIMIDDFLVPGAPQFGYDEYDGQECSFEYIKDSMAKNKQYRIIYPTYTEHTSPHHPLRGWVYMQDASYAELTVAASLKDKIRTEIYDG